MHLSGIYVYPVKSCAGIALEAWALDALGLRHDRRFMVVLPDGRFVTQREHPRLALVRTALEDLEGDAPRLRLDVDGAPPLRVPLVPSRGAPIDVAVWDDRVTAERVSDDADRFFSAHLGVEVHLAFMPSSTVRAVDPTYAAGARTGFADGFPLLLTSEASLDALNQRLAQPVPMDRFRPNLVVSGAPAFAEDAWRELTIGELTLRIVKPCARCPIITTDQRTAEVHPAPLRALADFRRGPGGVYFGQNAIHLGEGTLRRGDGVRLSV